MIQLFTFPGNDEVESVSPFCMKVEVYLKLQKLEYKSDNGDPRKAPKGKVPFIEVDGKRVADSSTILAHLEEKADSPLDRGLDATGRAQSLVLQRLFEESLYFCLLWSRWGDDDGWSEMRPRIAPFFPAAVRWFVPDMIRKKVIAQAVAQGTGRHSRDEIYALGKADIDAIATLLGDKPYFLGDQLRTIDVIAHSFLANIMYANKKPSPLAEAALSHANLKAFVKQIRERLKAGRRSE